MNLKKIILILLLCTLIISCSSNNNLILSTDSTTIPENLIQPNNVGPTGTFSSTHTPPVHEPPFDYEDLRLDMQYSGKIMLFNYFENNDILIIDFDEEEVLIIEQPQECNYLYGNVWSICNTSMGISNGGGEIYLYNLISRVTMEINLAEPEWYSLNSNESYLLSAYQQPNHEWSYYSFNLNTNSITMVIENLGYRFLENPILSNDGNKLFGVRYGSFDSSFGIYEISENTERQIYSNSQDNAATNIIFSPNSDSLMFGSTTVITDVWYGTTSLNLLSTSIGEFEKIYIAPEGKDIIFFPSNFSEIWSPDSQKIIIGLDNGDTFCVITIDTADLACSVIGGIESFIEFVNWSADSSYILLGVYNLSDRSYDLFIYSPVLDSLDLLLNDVEIDGFDWQ